MSERKLARVVVIDELVPIEGADRIELAIVGGWQVVVQKGLYVPGETKAVYFEVDSLLDTERPYFNSLATLSSKLLHVVDGRTHARIKTMKLRKQLSQGFCVPLSETGLKANVGDDLTEALGVVKYEKTEEKNMNNSGSAVAKTGFKALGFPNFIPKTDQNRVQNITHLYNKAFEDGELFEKTFKLDGSSLTVWIKDGVVGVASRNVGFRMEDEKIGFFQAVKTFLRTKKWNRVIKADDNQFTQAAKEQGLDKAVRRMANAYGRDIALQGELVGPSIQKNFEGVDSNQFYLYDIFDITEQMYVLPARRRELAFEFNVQHVPTPEGGEHTRLLPSVQEAIADADGPSGLNGKYREGFVYKSHARDFSFKVISNSYLLKEE